MSRNNSGNLGPHWCPDIVSLNLQKKAWRELFRHTVVCSNSNKVIELHSLNLPLFLRHWKGHQGHISTVSSHTITASCQLLIFYFGRKIHSIYWPPSLLTNFNQIPWKNEDLPSFVKPGKEEMLQPQQLSVAPPSAHVANYHGYNSIPAVSNAAGVGGPRRVLQMTRNKGRKQNHL